MPVHDHLQAPLRLDEHSEDLLARYGRRRARLNGELSCYLGRSRVATLSEEREGREACTYRGRCLWGCPTGALYTPDMTLDECRRHSGFEYLGGRFA